MRTRHGFTLIELLVVIAIIAILAAILFPVFAQAREKARQTTCLSNGKQIGLATMMYVNDYDEMFPFQQWRDWGDAQVPGRRRAWTMDIAPYVKAGQYGTSGHGAARGVGGIFICPSHPDPKQVFHYGVHESLFRGCWWGSPGEIQPCNDPSASLAQIDRPSEIAMVLEKGRADFQDVQPDGTSNS
jgi:prepilin-type N-terminal cleavage/methylation domain-containing protein